jgi:hypothetical protein
LKNGPFEVADDEFKAVYGKDLPPAEPVPGQEFTMNSLVVDISTTFWGKLFQKIAKKPIQKMCNTTDDTDPSFRAMWATLSEAPLRLIVAFGHLSMDLAQILLDFSNRRYLRGIRRLLSTLMKRKK